jgi:anti-sigma factor RsiW
MSEHVLDWLGAYHDGELTGSLLRRVEAHLQDCAACQTELAALQALSTHLQIAPAAVTRARPDQFVAQVQLRLPTRRMTPAQPTQLERAAGIWLPLGVFALWTFSQAVLLVGGVAVSVFSIPLPGIGALALLIQQFAPAGWGVGLEFVVLSVSLTISAAVLLWGSLAVWWAARRASLKASQEMLGQLSG